MPTYSFEDIYSQLMRGMGLDEAQLIMLFPCH